MEIKIVKLGEAIQSAHLPEGTTLGQAIGQAVDTLNLVLDASNMTFRVNGIEVDEDTVLTDGDLITAQPPAVKGGM